MTSRYSRLILLASIFFIFMGCQKSGFNSQNAISYIKKQINFGPRIPGSESAIAFQEFLIKELRSFNWIVEEQKFSYKGVKLNNIIAMNSTKPPDIIIGTHYDTRGISDQEQDPSKRDLPVPGANDGASGTAVLIEIARSLQDNNVDIWLTFFDAEDQGGIADWEWSVGAEYFTNNLQHYPNEVIIIDMVGDKDLRIFKETYSSVAITDKVWQTATELGYERYFINKEKHAIIDDHLPFLNKGIPSCLIIDMDYDYWHTTEDIVENTSQDSLEIIGNVLIAYLEKYYSN